MTIGTANMGCLLQVCYSNVQVYRKIVNPLNPSVKINRLDIPVVMKSIQ